MSTVMLVLTVHLIQSMVTLPHQLSLGGYGGSLYKNNDHYHYHVQSRVSSTRRQHFPDCEPDVLESDLDLSLRGSSWSSSTITTSGAISNSSTSVGRSGDHFGRGTFFGNSDDFAVAPEVPSSCVLVAFVSAHRPRSASGIDATPGLPSSARP